ncbi:MAG: YihY/virulence factor BrkB family protein [Muribaculaceae bacterium]|nr:YihY/virulence factor BrkB family protein [Muribaculaceae bacterium]
MEPKEGFFSRLGSTLARWWDFAYKGVWKTTKNTPGIRLLKTLNLTVTSFFDRDLLTRAASLTFDTLLALVPALALIFAIGRGFGLQDLLRDQLFSYFPAQREAIETAVRFVDSYLNESTQGVFVGVGIIVLLYTLISLLSSIEESFNYIWGIKKERSFYQKLTDYIAICLLIPILMICSSGVSIFLSTVFQTDAHIPFLTPLVNWLLDLFPLVLLWLAFSLSFLLIPNTKVTFKYAAISGAVSAIAFQILELLFLNGQIYVTKYNAIYGSFAFLPLLLVWLQFSWVILLSGGTLCYSLQNVFAYNYMANTSQVSNDYMRKVALVVGVVITTRFEKGLQPLTCNEIAREYELPLRLVSSITDQLHAMGLVNYVVLENDAVGVAPGEDISNLSAARFLKALDKYGDSDFIPTFNTNYAALSEMVDQWESHEWEGADAVLLKNLEITTPEPPSPKK